MILQVLVIQQALVYKQRDKLFQISETAYHTTELEGKVSG